MCVHACVFVHMNAGACTVQKKEPGSLELELQKVVSQTLVLGTEFRFSRREESVLNPKPFLKAPDPLLN